MKITIKEKSTWDGDNFQVIINGTKFPKARGTWYTPVGEFEEEKKAKAIEYAKAEYEGKYLSNGGKIYNTRKEFEKEFWGDWDK